MVGAAYLFWAVARTESPEPAAGASAPSNRRTNGGLTHPTASGSAPSGSDNDVHNHRRKSSDTLPAYTRTPSAGERVPIPVLDGPTMLPLAVVAGAHIHSGGFEESLGSVLAQNGAMWGRGSDVGETAGVVQQPPPYDAVLEPRTASPTLHCAVVN